MLILDFSENILIFENLYLCLACTLGLAFLIIAIFNYYISVVNDVSFKKRFIEMASLSLIVAVISLVIGYLIRSFLGVEIWATGLIRVRVWYEYTTMGSIVD